MRFSLLVLINVSLAIAQNPPALVGTAVAQQGNTNIEIDDTLHTSAWTATTGGGTFSGGRLFTTCNDCSTSISLAQNSNVAFLEVTSLNLGTMASTLSVVNRMTSYGTAAASSCFGGSTTCKSSMPFSLNNVIYLFVQTQDNNAPYNVFRVGLIMSPDFGAHWCNYLTYTTGVGGTPNLCNSSNWSATGDAPAGSSGLQWPGAGEGTATNKMARPTIVQVCQDNTVSCPTLPAGYDSSTYIYFFTMLSTNTNQYLSRVDKTCTGAPMLPACWTHWDGSTWNSDYTQLSNVNGNGLSGFNSSAGGGVIWDDHNQVFMAFGGNTTTLVYVWSADLKTGWTGRTDVSCKLSTGSNCYGGFPCPILATYTYDTHHGVRFAVSSDDGFALKHGYFQYLTVNASNARGGAQ